MTVHTQVPDYFHAPLAELAKISERSIRKTQEYGRVVIITKYLYPVFVI